MDRLSDYFFSIGAVSTLGALGQPTDFADFNVKVAKVHALESDSSGDYGRMIAGIGATTLAEAGLAGSFEHELCVSLCKSAEWHPEYQVFIGPLLEAFGKAAVKTASDMLTTPANALATVADLAPASGRAVVTAGDALKHVYEAASLGGVGLGALLWQLSRHGKQDDLALAPAEGQRRFYRRAASQIQNELKSHGVQPVQ